MTTKHTPGPWKEEDCKIFDCNDKKIAATCWVSGNGATEKANARLIASAPELLDLAKEALAQLEQMDFTLSANWNGTIKTNVALLLSAAIAKAEGRE